MTEPKDGLTTAVSILLARSLEGRQVRQAEQLALIPTPALAEEIAAERAEEKRGPGRPKGSLNRSTNEWIDFLAARYRSPLQFLAESYNRPTEQLAEELQCKAKDAYALQMKAAEALAPYWHQKQPQAIQLDENSGMVALVIGRAPAAAPGQPQVSGSGAKVIDMPAIESEEKQ